MYDCMCRYVTKHFNEDAKHSMNEMVKDIRAEMEKILDKIDWMDDMTRERAKDKLRTMKEYIGYPEEILQENLLEELYEVIIFCLQNDIQDVQNVSIVHCTTFHLLHP